MKARVQFNVMGLSESLQRRTRALAARVGVRIGHVVEASLEEYLPKMEAALDAQAKRLGANMRGEPAAQGHAQRTRPAARRPEGRPWAVGSTLRRVAMSDGKRYERVLKVVAMEPGRTRCAVLRGRGTEVTVPDSVLRRYELVHSYTAAPVAASANGARAPASLLDD